MGCNGDCGGCGGCKEMELAPLEVELLQLLGQVAFLPVARKGEYPVCKELACADPEQAGLALACLEKRGLVDLCYDAPLKGVDMGAYADYPLLGSAGLTARGQQVVDLMEIQGIG